MTLDKALINTDKSEIIKVITTYLQSKPITDLIVESHLSQSIIYRYRNNPDALSSAKFNTIYNLYQKATEDREKK